MYKKIMSGTKLHTRIIQKGSPPPCLKSGQRCYDCLGWRKLIHTARKKPSWRKYPFRCAVTSLTLKVESKNRI